MVNFQDSWLKEDIFKEWMVKIFGDPKNAYCWFCEKRIRAHRSDVVLHSNCNTHKKLAVSIEGSGVSLPKPAVVKLVQGNLARKAPSTSPSGRITTILTDGKGRKIGGRRAPKGHNSLKYREEWERDDNLRGWMKKCEDNKTRVECTVCKTTIRAHKGGLKEHSETNAHRENVAYRKIGIQLEKNYPDFFKSGKVEKDVANAGEKTVIADVAPNVIDDNETINNPIPAIKTDIEMKPSGVYFNMNCTEPPSLSISMPLPIHINRQNEHKLFSEAETMEALNDGHILNTTLLASNSRARLDSLEVIVAIEQDDFNEHELNQILTCVQQKINQNVSSFHDY